MGIELLLGLIGTAASLFALNLRLIQGVTEVDRKIQENSYRMESVAENVKEIKLDGKDLQIRITHLENYLSKNTDFEVRH